MGLQTNFIAGSEVTISGSVTTTGTLQQELFPSSSATQVVAGTTTVQTATYTIHTVTAGKTLYITSAWCTCAPASTMRCWIEVDTGGGSYIPIIACYGVASAALMPNGGVSINFPIPIQVAENDLVRLAGSAANYNGIGGITGWEE